MQPLVTFHIDRGVAVATVRGEIDMSNAAGFEHALRNDRPVGASALVIDLTDVAHFDSSALAVIAGLAKGDLPVRLVAPRTGVARRVLEIVRFDRLFAIHEELSTALAAAGDRPSH